MSSETKNGTAGQLVKEMGASLVGRTIYTERYGDWPGGQAIVKQIAPDPKAPEIVFTVLGIGSRINNAVLAGKLDTPVIGVFEHEIVDLRWLSECIALSSTARPVVMSTVFIRGRESALAGRRN